MAVRQEIIDFVKNKLSAGKSKLELRNSLKQIGYYDSEINEIFSRVAISSEVKKPASKKHFYVGIAAVLIILIAVALYATSQVTVIEPDNEVSLGALTEVEQNVKVGKDSDFTFTVNDEEHTTEIIELNSDSVTITIFSNPISLTILIGETKKVDLDSDGINDIEVTLIGIEDGKANLKFKRIPIIVQQIFICEDGMKKMCNVDYCPGIQTCNNNAWSNCVDTPNDNCPAEEEIIEPECITDSDCDSQSCKVASCVIDQCMYTSITACVSGDNCCPTGCTALTDNDCTTVDSDCGDSYRRGTEICDSDYVDCSTLGDYESGVNAPCKSDCSGYDSSGCTLITPNSICGDGICDSGETCSSCVADCGTCDPYTTTWTTLLVTEFGKSRTIEISPSKEIVWEKTSSIPAFDAKRLSNGNTLISYQNKIVEINSDGDEIWQTTTIANPADIEKLTNGNILVVDSLTDYVAEINLDEEIVWEIRELTYDISDAERLDNGNTLINGYNTAPKRITEFDSSKNIVWEYLDINYNSVDIEKLTNGNILFATSYPVSAIIEIDLDGNEIMKITGLNYPMDSERLANGNTIIADTHNNRIIEVGPSGNIVWEITGLLLPSSVEVLN